MNHILFWHLSALMHTQSLLFGGEMVGHWWGVIAMLLKDKVGFINYNFPTQYAAGLGSVIHSRIRRLTTSSY